MSKRWMVVTVWMVALSASGVVSGQGEFASGMAPPESATELFEELAELEAQTLVEGKPQEALRALRALRRRAATVEAYAEQEEALVRIALVRARILSELGDYTAALEATRALLLGQDEGDVPADERLRRLADRARGDERLISVRRFLDRVGRSSDEAGTPSLGNLIAECFAEGDMATIHEIGSTAFPYLAPLVAASKDDFPGTAEVDPLLVLFLIDERRGARFALERVDDASALWRRRILRAMTEGDVLANEGTWTSSTPALCLEPEWLGVLTRLLAHPDAATECLPLVHVVERQDALPGELVEALVHGLRAYDESFRSAVLGAFDVGNVQPSARRIYEAALAIPEAPVRRWAAARLAGFDTSDALLALAGDDDPLVRREVVRGLASFTRRSGRGVSWRTRQMTPTEHGLLAGFLADPVEEIRLSAIRHLHGLSPTLPTEVYERLAEDESSAVRVALAELEGVPPQLHGRILELLADDADVEVLAQVKEALYEAEHRDPTPYLAALRIHLRTSPDDRVGQSLCRTLINENVPESGFHAMVELADVSETLMTYLLDHRGSSPHFGTLPPDVFVRFLRRAHHLDPKQAIRVLMQGSGPTYQAGVSALTTDADAPVELRLLALGRQKPAPGREAALLALLRTSGWTSLVINSESWMAVQRIVLSLPAARRNAFLLELVRGATLPPRLADVATQCYEPSAPKGADITNEVLARWLDLGTTLDTVELALASLSAEHATVPLLERAIRNERYVPDAIELMTRLRKPEHLPLMGALVLHPEDDYSEDAARGLIVFPGTETAEYLLQGLRSDDYEVREICSENLTWIETHEQRAERWRSRAKAPSKENTLFELVELLDDDEPTLRAAAARGLGTLGAVEAMPNLIRLLKDASVDVRHAAEEALEHLRRLPLRNAEGEPRRGRPSGNDEPEQGA